jgi:hypothetical protein
VKNIRDFHYRTPRFQTDFQFLVHAESDRFVYGRCYQISEQGLIAWLPEPLSVDTRATLIFTLPGESTEISIAATVSRRFGFDHAFTFTSFSPQDQAHLHQYSLRAKTR